MTRMDLVVCPLDCVVVGALVEVFTGRVGPSVGSAVAASTLGIHRKNGVRSATSMMYQIFLVASQRAPNAFAASFSANGVTKLILIW